MNYREIQPAMGVSHPSCTAAPVAAGVMQHLGLNVDTEADLLAIRDRVRSHGHWVMGPIDHGFCKSIYLGNLCTGRYATTAWHESDDGWVE
jgi:hypothetical protein